MPADAADDHVILLMAHLIPLDGSTWIADVPYLPAGPLAVDQRGLPRRAGKNGRGKVQGGLQVERNTMGKHFGGVSRLMAVTAIVTCAFAVPTAADPSEALLVMTWQGTGGITAETPYEAEALRALLPGFEVAINQRTVEGASEVSIVVRKGGSDILLIHANGDAVGSITAVGDGVADEAGLTIGKSTFADFGPPEFVDCYLQEETDTPLVICEERDSFITHLFATPKRVKAGDDGRVPTQAIPPQSILKRMVWYAAG